MNKWEVTLRTCVKKMKTNNVEELHFYVNLL